MSDDTITIEVDGKSVEAKKGQMIIQATDAVGAYIPRFCYHEKLSIAANCRMCLIEVEKAPKPLPACATPVADGMKVFTKSPAAIAADHSHSAGPHRRIVMFGFGETRRVGGRLGRQIPRGTAAH